MTQGTAQEPFDRSISALQSNLNAGRTSAEEAVRLFLSRIDALDRATPENDLPLNSIIAVNPDIVAHAQERDRERRDGRVRGPLHGIPILVKDNIETKDRLATTAGSLALAGNFAEQDAPCIARLRAAGAIILGKANLSEWANFRSNRSTSGWSAVGGLTRNPHVLDRSACGSSSGSAAAVAAGLAVAAVGTETDGSIVCPSEVCGIVGLKPTVGLVPRTRIIPISESQDTAGPMTRCVEDAALLLSVMAGRDGADRATAKADRYRRDYAAALDPAALRGARLGVWRPRRATPEVMALFERALATLHEQGAQTVEVPAFRPPKDLWAFELSVMLAEFKAGLDAYLASTPSEVRVRSLAELIAFNRGEPRELSLFGQELFEAAEKTSLSDPAYLRARNASRRKARRVLAAAFSEHKLECLVTVTGGPSWRIDLVRGDNHSGESSGLPAVAGYPHLTVPMGTVHRLPVGLSFIGPAWSEARLLALGYAFEQAAQARPTPSFLRSLETEAAGELAPTRASP